MKESKLGIKFYKFICLLCCMMLAISLTACGKSGTRVVFTTGFGKDEIFRIGDAVCTKPEIMLYLTTTQNQYENVYGLEVWEVAKGDITLEDNVKETVLARMAQIKTMCLLAKEKELTLEEEEEQRVETATERFYSSLNETERESLGLDREIIQSMYQDYALANKVYQYIIQDVNPEISDDEARTITVQQIFLRTWTTDGGGNRVDYETDMKEPLRSKIQLIREKALEGEEEFTELASKYSQSDVITEHYKKGEVPDVVENVIFSLETDEISPVIETEDGFYLIKCINTFDREETDANKLKIVEQRKREVFGEEYDAFTQQLVRQLNTNLWESIELIHDEAVKTVNFFAIYDGL